MAKSFKSIANTLWIPAKAGIHSRWITYQKVRKNIKLAKPLILISPLALQGGCPRSGRGVNKNPSARKLATPL